MVICVVAGALGVEGAVGEAIFPLLQPVIAPMVSMQTNASTEPRRRVDRLRRPAKPSRPSGSNPASTTRL